MESTKRDAVWNGMVQSDRLTRYYRMLAAQLSTRDRYVSWAFTAAASVFAGASFLGQDWALNAAVLLAILGMGPVGRPSTRRIVNALHCRHQLSKVHAEWKELWREVDGGGDVPSSAIRSLSNRESEITAQCAQDWTNDRVYKRSEKESYDFWRKSSTQRDAIAAARETATAT